MLSHVISVEIAMNYVVSWANAGSEPAANRNRL